MVQTAEWPLFLAGFRGSKQTLDRFKILMHTTAIFSDSLIARWLNMSKNIQDPAFDDAVVAEKVEALTDFCVNKLFFGLIPKTFVTTIFVLLFSFLGFPTRRISAITGFCEKTVRRKIKTMNSKGFEVVFARKTGVGRKSRTTSTLKKIEEDLDTHDYRCTRQIRHMLSTVFKIDLKSLIYQIFFEEAWL